MTDPTKDVVVARSALVEAVRIAVPAIRKNHEEGRGELPPKEEGAVHDALLQFFGALNRAKYLDVPSSKQSLKTLPVSLDDIRITLSIDEHGDARFEGAHDDAFVSDAGGTSVLLLAVADGLEREIEAGRLWHDKAELNDAIALVREQGELLQRERRPQR